MDFSTQIKQQRQQLGLTQADVANQLFVTRQTISNWEQGKSYPDLNMLVKLSDVYQISLDSLLKGDTRLKNYLEQGKAYNSFSVLRGLFFIIYGLLFLLIEEINDISRVMNCYIFGLVILLAIGIIYGEHVKPFFLGITNSKYNRMFHEPLHRSDQRYSLAHKVCLAVLVVVIVAMVLTHSDYLLTLAMTIMGLIDIFQKYMWKPA